MVQNISKLISFCLLAILLSLFNTYDLYGYNLKKNQKKAQELIENAVNQYRKGEIDISEKLISQSFKYDTTNVKAYLLLSDIYADKKEDEKQISILKKVVTFDSLNYSTAYKLLGNLLFNKGDYTEAFIYYSNYSKFNPPGDSLFVHARIKSCLFATESILNSKDVSLSRLDSNINTSKNEYWPAISIDDSILYFTRLIDDKKDYPFERLFFSKKELNAWSRAEQIDFTAESEVNIGTMCISADGKLLFMTMCGLKGGRGSCDIFYSKKINGLWSTPVNAGSIINGKSWDSQPSVSADNRFLYFASSRPGGFGGMDIWRSEFIEMPDGSLFFQSPENLGTGINSSHNDYSPYIHSDGITLYFASEGKYGLGGSDLFVSRLNDSIWCDAINFGYPVNSRFNEDGIVISTSGESAFFASDRGRSTGNSKDIFQFKVPTEYLPNKVGYIKGYVLDNLTSRKLKANVEITNLETGDIVKKLSDPIDGFTATLIANRKYALNVNLKGYLFYSRHFDLTDSAGFQQAQNMIILLDPIKSGNIVELSNVFFDFNSAVIKEESFPELNQIALFLEKNPELNVEISGHTDFIGTEAYNLKLSEARAKAIYDYLEIRNGKERLSFKGYGSSMPLATNDTEEGRSRNRRCELKIK